MLPRSVTTCFSVFCVIFSIYLNPPCLSAILSNRQGKSILQNLNGVVSLRTNDEPSNMEGSITDETDAGFDFTDEEIKKLKLWDKGLIPYYIDVLSFGDKVIRDRIRLYLDEVSSVTSLNFVELPRPPDDYNNLRWVLFINRRGLLGCADHSIKAFTNIGAQRVVLGYDCISNSGGLADAVLAIAGVPPQHNAPNRDDYIEILYGNIIPEKKYLYQKCENSEWLFHDLTYDFESASHISYHKHSWNGRATFSAKVPHGNTNIGQSNGLSYNDVLKIKMLYNYIAKKNYVKVRCSKLFSPGRNITRPTSNTAVIIKALKKPNKYLGLDSEFDNKQSDDNNANNEEGSKVTSSNDETTIDEINNSLNYNTEEDPNYADEEGNIINSENCESCQNNQDTNDATTKKEITEPQGEIEKDYESINHNEESVINETQEVPLQPPTAESGDEYVDQGRNIKDYDKDENYDSQKIPRKPPTAESCDEYVDQGTNIKDNDQYVNFQTHENGNTENFQSEVDDVQSGNEQYNENNINNENTDTREKPKTSFQFLKGPVIAMNGPIDQKFVENDKGGSYVEHDDGNYKLNTARQSSFDLDPFSYLSDYGTEEEKASLIRHSYKKKNIQ